MLSKCFFSKGFGGEGVIKTRADAGLDLKISTLDMEARKWRKKFDVSVASFRFHRQLLTLRVSYLDITKPCLFSLVVVQNKYGFRITESANLTHADSPGNQYFEACGFIRFFLWLLLVKIFLEI